ncbi:MAG: hypothetical protein AB7I50_10490 [Vicinamibacterales bacterium]
MTFDLEIMLRNDERVYTDTLDHERDVRDWTAADAKVVLEKILSRVGALLTPVGSEQQSVHLRGVSWIVSPYKDGVVIAMEIHSASAVAGPFFVPQADLDRVVRQAIHGSSSPTVH